MEQKTRDNIIIVILAIIVIALIAYTGYLLAISINPDNVAPANQTDKNGTTINESDPNGTNAEVSEQNVDYQSYDNNYGAGQASSSG